MNKKVLVTATGYSTYCKKAKQLLEGNNIEVIENKFGRPMTRDEILDVIADVDGVVVGVDTWDESIFSKAPKLKAMARFGVGVDNIDLESAREHGIVVSNAKGLNSEPVAELAVGMIISCLRNIPGLNSSTRLGKWERFMGRSLSSLTVGLLGFGEIAQKAARMLEGFGAKVVAYDLYPNLKVAKELNVQMVSPNVLLADSDVVSIHLPSLPDTYHFINEDRIGIMKDGAILVNTARGVLVDETALYKALKTGKLSFAASDVFEEEPVSLENPLLALDNFIVTPHSASETYEVYENVGIFTARALLDVFGGISPANRLN